MSDEPSNDQDEAERHKRRMQRKKEHIDGKVAQATEERGVLIVLTGNGKGKSSSAFGTAIRALGHGHKVGVVQFIKGTWECGERNFLQQAAGVDFAVMGTGFTWETQDKEVDRRAAEAVWPETARMLSDPAYHLVVLDELTYIFRYGYLDQAMMLEAIRNRPRAQSVIVTGRGAPPELIEMADTVSEIQAVKHAFQRGVKAQRGIEW